MTSAAWGIPAASERGTKSELAHNWATWLQKPCRLGGPLRFRGGGGKSQVAHKWARWLYNPFSLGDPRRRGAGDKITSGPQVGKLATDILQPWGSAPLPSGGGGGKIVGGPQVGKVAI